VRAWAGVCPGFHGCGYGRRGHGCGLLRELGGVVTREGLYLIVLSYSLIRRSRTRWRLDRGCGRRSDQGCGMRTKSKNNKRHQQLVIKEECKAKYKQELRTGTLLSIRCRSLFLEASRKKTNPLHMRRRTIGGRSYVASCDRVSLYIVAKNR
jgi:hypothetical protein